MDNPRPQLNRDELRLSKWLLGELLVLLAAWSVLYLEVDAWAWLVAIQLGVTAVLVKPELPAKIPRWAHRLAFPVVVGIFAWDLYSTGQALPALVRLGLSLIFYRAIIHRTRREDLQLVVLGLFIVIVTGVLTVSLLFAAQIALFTALALGLLLNLTLLDTQGRGQADDAESLEWTRIGWRKLARRVRQCVDWRMALLGGGLFSSVVVLAAVLFMAIPRYQLQSSMFLDRMMPGKSVSGFTDTLRFGDVSDLQKDESVALRVEVPDRNALPAQPYWRMVVMDEYRDQTFRLSEVMRREVFQPRAGVKAIEQFVLGKTRATSGAWTFYIEAGVGKWLPLSGGFRRLAFAEPQDVRIGRGLGLIELERDPSSMKAYRVEGMQMADTWPDTNLGEGQAEVEMLAGRWRGVSLAPKDREKLGSWAAEILGGKARPKAEVFARQAMAWVAKRHRYALQMQLPEGEGDVLVRWMESTQPGYCEMFAGAFVLLAREAGYSARVVGGFFGGTWNGDYLMVKNSHAHAWAEILEPGVGWVRVDPTAGSVGGAAGPESAAAALTGNTISEASGWSAMMDRVRMVWYRRVVNFEQSDQIELMESTVANAKKWGAGAKKFLDTLSERMRAWWTQPWSGGRVAKDVAWVAGFVVTAWLLLKQGRRLWRWRQLRAGGDPVRREAGGWLRRLAEAQGVERDAEWSGLELELKRLRYGPRESWGEPLAVFSNAKRQLKTRAAVAADR